MSLNFLRFILLVLFILLLLPLTKANAVPCAATLMPDGPSAASACEVDRNNAFNIGETTDPACTFHDIGYCDNPSNLPTICYFHAPGGGAQEFDICRSFPDPSCVPPQTVDPVTGLCEDPPPTGNECASTLGQITQGLVGAQPSAFVCTGGCAYELDNTFGGMTVTNTGAFTHATTVKYVGTGQPCGGGEGTNDPPTNTNVTDSDSDGIPEVDNQELPATPPPTNECVLLPNGGLYCGSNAGSPPSPDDGTPGNPAPPDQTVTNNTTNTTNNYYGPGTTSGSSGGTPDGQDIGVCDPSVETCGTDQGSASESGCGQLPTCTGDPILCTLLKIQHDTRCNLQTDTEDVTETEVMAQIGVTETIEDWKTNNDADPDNNIDVNTEFFSETPGNDVCPADFSISVPFMATPVVIPNQPICDFLDYLRPAVLALSYLVSGLMLFAAFREGI